MKAIPYLLVLALLFSCNKTSTPKEKAEEKQEVRELTYIEKLANAYGYESWNEVKEIEFTFNVNNQGKEFKREWRWQVKEDRVYMKVEGEEVGTQLNKNPDQQIHQAFINDSYWLLFPFQLMWTDGYDHKINEKVISPFYEKELTELVINFKEEGGYTPGDTYKLYINEDFKIEEWSFFPSGSEEPRIINAWDNYKIYEGLSISTDRRNVDGSFRIYFTDIVIKK